MWLELWPAWPRLSPLKSFISLPHRPCCVESEGLLREAFGLNSYEARIYLALTKGGMRAAEVALASGVPQSRTYDTLRELAQKGFVTEAEGVYAAVRPSAALRVRMAKLGRDFEAQQSVRDVAMKRIVAETEPSFGGSGRAGDPVMLRGMDSIAAAFMDVLGSSRDVFLVVRKGLRASDEFLGFVGAADRRKTRVRVLAPESARLSKADVKEATRLGLQVRRTPAAFLDIMVGDSDDVILGVPAKGEEEAFRAVAVRIRDESFSTALRSTFKAIWAEAKA